MMGGLKLSKPHYVIVWSISERWVDSQRFNNPDDEGVRDRAVSHWILLEMHSMMNTRVDKSSIISSVQTPHHTSSHQVINLISFTQSLGIYISFNRSCTSTLSLSTNSNHPLHPYPNKTKTKKHQETHFRSLTVSWSDCSPSIHIPSQTHTHTPLNQAKPRFRWNHALDRQFRAWKTS